jgi:hypothetical protein
MLSADLGSSKLYCRIDKSIWSSSNWSVQLCSNATEPVPGDPRGIVTQTNERDPPKNYLFHLPPPEELKGTHVDIDHCLLVLLFVLIIGLQ